MKIESETITIGEEASPFGQAHESLVQGDERSFTLANSTRSAYICVGFHVTANNDQHKSRGSVKIGSLSLQVLQANGRALGLVGDAEYCDYIPILGLRDELGDNSNIIEGALRIRQAHRPTENIDGPKFTRVIPSILATR